MPTIVPNLYLKDSTGNVWQVGATSTGLLSTQLALGQTGPPSILLADTVTAQTWQFSILTSGLLQLTGVPNATAQSQLLVNSPDGALWAITAQSGLLATSLGSSCQISLATADAALAARLYDAGGQFWPSAERLLYIQEAFREWNALTGYWRGDFLFNAQDRTTWYDLTDTSVALGTLRPLTLSVADLYTIIEYHLLEPPVGAGAWTGSAQFALSDIQSAVARHRDEALGVSGATITRIVIPATPGRTILPATTLEVRRIAFIPATGFGDPVVLWQDDAWAWQSFESGYTVAATGTPATYALTTQPQFAFDVDVQPNVAGSYELLTIQSATVPNTSTSADSLFLPDDWGWLLKWGALADLLGRESNAKDLLRAKYAEGRYRQGMALLAAAPALLGLRVGNVPIPIDAVKSADQYRTGWQAEALGAPQLALAAGMNLIALVPQSNTRVVLSLSAATPVVGVALNGVLTTGTLGNATLMFPGLVTGDLQNGGTFGDGGTFSSVISGVPGMPVTYNATIASGAAWTKLTLAGGTHKYQLVATLVSSQGSGVITLQTSNVGIGLWPGSATVASFNVSIDLAGGPHADLTMQGGQILSAPPPQTFSLTATVIQNAPVPTAPADCLLLTQDVYEAILDEAQHLAAFKMGGEEFLATMPLHQSFMLAAAVYSSKLAEMGEFTKVLMQQSQQESARNPRYSEDLDPAVGADG